MPSSAPRPSSSSTPVDIERHFFLSRIVAVSTFFFFSFFFFIKLLCVWNVVVVAVVDVAAVYINMQKQEITRAKSATQFKRKRIVRLFFLLASPKIQRKKPPTTRVRHSYRNN